MRSFRRAAVSLFLIGLAIAAMADWTTVSKKFHAAKSREGAIKTLSERDGTGDASDEEYLHELIDDYNSATTNDAKESTYQEIVSFVDSSAAAESFSTVKGAKAKAQAIKSDPLYKAERESTASNWIEKMLERLRNLFKRDAPQSPNLPVPPLWLGGLLQGLFYVIVGVAVIGLIYLIAKIPWSWTSRGKVKRARTGMLEEGEELLTEDEYLANADKLIAEGRYREACRALYLASLLRIDAARIARFEPTQTNWEHLRRIEASPTRPSSFDFRPATKAFDLAWYGYRANSIADVEIFRSTYLSIRELAKEAA
ncbi:MAG: DUF4129 domain-containing protein [Armatimonadetes bacterium]|nr:DUF4129 domain-containing protein [Armatimonadota bacterium]